MHTTRDQATAMVIPGYEDPALAKFENALFGELCRQHDRVDLFVGSKADEILRRMGMYLLLTFSVVYAQSLTAARSPRIQHQALGLQVRTGARLLQPLPKTTAPLRQVRARVAPLR